MCGWCDGEQDAADRGGHGSDSNSRHRRTTAEHPLPQMGQRRTPPQAALPRRTRLPVLGDLRQERILSAPFELVLPASSPPLERIHGGSTNGAGRRALRTSIQASGAVSPASRTVTLRATSTPCGVSRYSTREGCAARSGAGASYASSSPEWNSDRRQR